MASHIEEDPLNLSIPVQLYKRSSHLPSAILAGSSKLAIATSLNAQAIASHVPPAWLAVESWQ